ncbi:MAG: VOC family protein [Deltaproteobacteria bacterium]
MKAARKLARAVAPIPEGYHTVTACLTIRGAGKAIEFYRKAFGAELLDRVDGPDGKSVMHAALRIGDSRIFLGDELPGTGCRSPESLGGATSSFYLYVKDADAAVRQAVDAGGTLRQPVTNAFWGDRFGSIADPFGYAWDLATHVEDVPPGELRKRAEAFTRELASKTRDTD